MWNYRGAALAAVLGMGASACSLGLETELPDVCVTRTGIQAPTTNAVLQSQTFAPTTVPLSYEYDFGDTFKQLEFDKGDLLLRVASVEIKANQGVSDFSFVKNARFGVRDVSGQHLPSVTILAYDPPAGTAASKTLTLTGTSTVDLHAYLSSGKIGFTGEVTGTSLPASWSVDIKSCFSATAKVDYAELLKSN